MMRKNQGVTLISLVVTIIILLILAGVTLALISGSSGILGKAADAVDKNKVAMAKEQVELKLAEFQEDFYEEKYVTKTNNGEKKDYLSEKLEQGVVTQNYYAKASEDGNVIVYEGNDLTGNEVVKGSIQNDGSIKWDDQITGGGAQNPNNPNGSTADLSNYITKEEYEKSMAELESKIDKLAAQSQIKTGKVSFGAIAAASGIDVRVEFNTPFEDANYSVVVTTSPTFEKWSQTIYGIQNKTKEGFSVRAYNSLTIRTGSATADWIAIPYQN